MSKPIYIVGFPRSGNTWLTRLLADVLQAHVRSRAMRGSLEAASEINQRLSLPTDTAFTIVKIHFLPKMFFEEIDEAPERILYVYRDFRDVAVSAFFYWNNCDEADVRIANLFSLILRGPRSFMKFYRYRRRFTRYLVDLCIGGVEWFEEFTGTWSQHIVEWRDVRTQRPNINIVYISYEQLLNDAASTVLGIIRMLNLPEPTDNRLQNAIERQSIEALRGYFHKLPNEAKIPFGKKFNIKFLRKGLSGDWKNFLSPEMRQIIHKYHGKMLFELGYESDPCWYEKIDSDAP